MRYVELAMLLVVQDAANNGRCRTQHVFEVLGLKLKPYLLYLGLDSLGIMESIHD